MFAGDQNLLTRLKAIHDRLDEYSSCPTFGRALSRCHDISGNGFSGNDHVDDGCADAKGREEQASVPTATGDRRTPMEIWLHIHHFLKCWVTECAYVIEKFDDTPVPLQKVYEKEEPRELVDIAAEDSPIQLWPIVQARLLALHSFIARLDETQVNALGVDPDKGVMSIYDILEECVIGHIERHVTQLGALHDTSFA